MKRAFAALLLLGVSFAEDEPPKVSHESLRDMIFLAVLEGLYTDGVDNASLDVLLAKEKTPGGERYTHFIYACPICMPALNAFLVYRARPDFYGVKGVANTLGAGLAPELRTLLRDGGFRDRLQVLHDLVRTWIGRRLGSQRLTETEKASWTRALEEGRAEGMKMLQEFQRHGQAGSFGGEKACAVCDGATMRE